jgi:hypothetical protein
MVRKVSDRRCDGDNGHGEENTGQSRKYMSATHLKLQGYINKGIFRTNINLVSMAARANLLREARDRLRSER